MVERRVDLLHGLPLVRLDGLVELAVQLVEFGGRLRDLREALTGVVELDQQTPRLLDQPRVNPQYLS